MLPMLLLLALPMEPSVAADPVWLGPEPVFALARPAPFGDLPPMEYT